MLLLRKNTFSLFYPNPQHSPTYKKSYHSFIFFAIYKYLLKKKEIKKQKQEPLSFSHSLHKSFSGCFPRLFKIPNTRSSPAFLPIQFKLMEGHRYNLKYKMTNHVHEFQIHIYSCIWLWICVTDLKCSANKMKQHYGI